MMWRLPIAKMLLTTSCLFSISGAWAEFTIQIRSQADLAGAVLVATAEDGQPAGSLQSGAVTMVQANRQFDPFILPVPRNVPVSFPNHDDTAHHVYSFSPVGAFELPLYKGDSPAPITFTRPGVVPLGCNIHDWMIGYIYVVDSPFYTQLENGSARFDNLPEGRFEITLWHPALDGQSLPTWQITVPAFDHVEVIELDRQVSSVVQPIPPKTRFDEQADY